MNHHDLIDGNPSIHNLEDMSCLADAKPDANGLSSTDELRQSAPSSSSQEQLLLVELRETNQLLRELLTQNAVLINLVFEEREEDEEMGGSQYLDGSRES